jgi:hypothetical protein
MGKRPLYRLIDFAASERESYQKGYRKSARLRLEKSKVCRTVLVYQKGNPILLANLLICPQWLVL